MEANPKYVELAREVVAWVEQPGHAAVTSTITMTELLVKPYRELGDRQEMVQLYGLFSTDPNLEWIAPDLAVAGTVVTNDASFERVPAFEALVLERLR